MSNKFVMSKLFLTLFVGFLTVALFTMLFSQTNDVLLYNITMMQVVSGIAGMFVLLMSVMGGTMVFDWNNRLEPEPFDTKRGWLFWGIIGLSAARILGGLVTSLPLSSTLYINSTIAMTSALFEEPLFCGLGLMFYTILLRATKDQRLAVMFSTIMVAVLFGMFHIGVYGLVLSTFVYVVIGRIVYNLIFLKTRTILTPTFAHFSHNVLISVLGW